MYTASLICLNLSKHNDGDIMRKIYWIFLLLYIVIIMILQKKYENIKQNLNYWVGLLVFALFPFVISWISRVLESKL